MLHTLAMQAAKALVAPDARLPYGLACGDWREPNEQLNFFKFPPCIPLGLTSSPQAHKGKHQIDFYKPISLLAYSYNSASFLS